METKDDFQAVEDHLTTPGTSFSQLLLADNDVVDVDHTFSSSSLFSLHNSPKMLSFQNYQNQIETVTTQKSVITNSSDSSSASSCNHTNTGFKSLTTTTLTNKPNGLQKKRNGSGEEQELGNRAGVGGQRGPKKTKSDNNPTSTGHAKKKEKLGERIAALQKLVSPFGKTDTASVLHEATGYIRFLHDQVQVLCSAYLEPSQLRFQNQTGGGDSNNNGIGKEEQEVKKDLRSKGLCLIPIGCTLDLANSNGADFWSPTTIGNNVSPSNIPRQ